MEAIRRSRESQKEARKNAIKKPRYSRGFFINPGTGLSFQAVSRQVLSLLIVFTFVFGMGTGVFRSQGHQEPFRVAWRVFLHALKTTY